MTDIMKDGGPAFPRLYPRADEEGRGGMSLRDYFAIHAPEPTEEEILAWKSRIERQEQMANPHNEPYANKVRRRGTLEIKCSLRFAYADAMLAEREK